MNEIQLQAFMADPELSSLIEQVKVSDDILDVIRLGETQHSAMLAWCLNPAEGHGQGDAVIKDFLIAAYNSSISNGCIHDTKKFFKSWTPARIRRTSFGSAFITREFHIDLEKMGRKGRLDLLMVDPQNRLLVAIENKCGATLTKEQLNFYSDTVNQKLGTRPAFREFDFAFVVLDRELEDYDVEDLEDISKRWCLLDYSWLETASARAKQHVARNNQAAQLLMAYCQSITDWQKPAQQATTEIATRLAERHKTVVDEMKALRASSIHDWTPSVMNAGDLCHFFYQNRLLCRELIAASGIPGMVKSLQKKMEKSAIVDKDGPTRLSLATVEMLSFQKGGQPWWPMYIQIRKRAQADSDEPTYELRFVINHSGFAVKPGPLVIRTALNTIVKGLITFPESNHRRVTLRKQLSAERAMTLAVELAAEVDKALNTLTSV